MSVVPHSADEIIWNALQLEDLGSRHEYVERVCGDNLGLREEVLRLLELAPQAATFLEPQAPFASDSISNEPWIGRQIGAYRLLEILGEGGMGIVYRAEQEAPIRRQVALKIVKPGMDTREVIARFEAERQALSLMDHPNIARIHDAGTTTDGRPFFVMELVDGVPITQYCQQNELSTRKRIRLFITLCEAIQAAHEKGLIHRDIKPSNVLVAGNSGAGCVKVIDFGVAKAVSGPLGDRTQLTHMPVLMGTPTYMSPEQLSMSVGAVDTRSDVYALGSVLYELLLGETPFSRDTLTSQGFPAFVKLVSETDPLAPTKRSQVAATATASSNDSPHNSRHKDLTRELDWITLKALARDRNERYSSPQLLADDLRRYLHNEPVEASPPSLVYQCRKFAQRHKALMTAVAIGAGGLLLATVISLQFAWRAYQAEQLADSRLALATQHAATAELHAFTSDMLLATRALRANDVGQTYNLLMRYSDDTSDLASSFTGSFIWNYLANQVMVPGQSLLQTDSSIYWVEFSPSGQRIACCGADGRIYLIDATTNEILHQLDAVQGEINGLAFSHDGQRIAAAGDDGFVTVWDAERGEELLRFQALDDHAYRACFSPDDKTIVCAGRSDSLSLHDAQSGERIGQLTHSTLNFESIDVSPQGLVAAAGRRDIVVVWDLETREIVWEHSLKSNVTMSSVRFSESGRILAAGNLAGDVIAIRMDQPESPLHHVLLRDGVRSTSVSERLQAIVVGDDHGQIHLLPLSVDWLSEQATDGERDELLPLERYAWPVHDNRVYAVGISPRTGHVISGAQDGKLVLTELAKIQRSHTIGSHISHLAARGDQLFCSTPEGVQIRSLSEPHSPGDYLPPTRDKLGFKEVACASHGKATAAIGVDDRLVVWNHLLDEPFTLREPSKGQVLSSVTLSPNDEYVAVMVKDRVQGRRHVSVWSLRDRRETRKLVADSIHVVHFINDSQLIYNHDNVFRIVDITTGEIQQTLAGHTSSIRGITTTANGQTAFSVAGDRTLKRWDLRTGELTWSVVGHADDIIQLACDATGENVITLGRDNVARFWQGTLARMTGEVPIAIGLQSNVIYVSPDQLAFIVDGRENVHQLDGRPIPRP